MTCGAIAISAGSPNRLTVAVVLLTVVLVVLLVLSSQYVYISASSVVIHQPAQMLLTFNCFVSVYCKYSSGETPIRSLLC